MHHLTSLSHGHFSLANRCLARIRRLENLLEFFQCFPCRFHKELQVRENKSVNMSIISGEPREGEREGKKKEKNLQSK